MTDDVGALTERQLRVLCKQLLSDLGLDGNPAPHELCARLGASRGRPIALEPQRIPGVDGSGFGALIPMPDEDIIVYPVDVSPPWQGHIIFHEVLHLVRAHADSGQLLCGADADLSAEADDAGSGRYFDSWMEWEAETGAMILAEIADRRELLIDADRPDISPAEQAYARAVGGRFLGRRP